MLVPLIIVLVVMLGIIGISVLAVNSQSKIKKDAESGNPKE
jgi:hypothetical protein